jgi:hypothetical protein
MTTDKRGVSPLLLQRQLGLRRYGTAFMMLLHKCRRAMVNSARVPLKGEIEADDTWVGGRQAGLRGSRATGYRVQTRPSQPTFANRFKKGCEVGRVVGGSCSPGPEICWTVHWEHLMWKMF